MSRQPHKPSAKTREQVGILTTAGVTQERIAAVIGIDKKTLIKWYRSELDIARDQALGRNTALLMREADGGNVTAMIYLQKCLGGPLWREKQDVQLSGGFTVVAAKPEDWKEEPVTPLIEVHGDGDEIQTC